MKILIARHGQTLFNLENKLQGRSNSNLTELGQTQAIKLGQYIATHEIKTVHLSPLQRVLDTFKLMNVNTATNINITAKLSEVCYGSWEEMEIEKIKSSTEWTNRKNDKYSFNHAGSYKGIKGESYKDLFTRVKPLFEEISIYENVFMMSHLGVMRCALIHYANIEPNKAMHTELKNNTILEITLENGSFKVKKRSL